MPTFASDYLAIRALETRLAALFGTTLAATYATYGGVDVKVRTDEDDEPEFVGRPMILLELTSGDRSEWSSARAEYRSVSVGATTLAGDFSGATQGTANTVTSDELISRALVQDIEANYVSYRDLGLGGISITSQALNKSEGDTKRRIPHTIQFSYERA